MQMQTHGCKVNMLKFLFLLCITLARGTPLADNRDELADAAANEKTDEKPVYRLSDDYELSPLQYTIRIKPDLTALTFSGTADIAFRVSRVTNEVRLFGKNLEITRCTIKQQDTTTDCTYRLDKDNDLVIITPTTQLEANAEYTTTLTYFGTIYDGDPKGLYRTSYYEDGQRKWLAITHLEPTYAREVFPCFDHPRFKTPHTIHIARRSNQQAISNMALQETRDDTTADSKWDIFATSQPIPTHLVAFAIFELSKKEGTENINIWANTNQMPFTTYALTQVPKIRKSLQDWTNVEHKMTKLDIVVVPEMKIAAMQNWGLATYKERYIILDEASTSITHKMAVTGLISRELSQHWFGNILTPNKWDYLWLREGFATYFEYYGAALVEPNWNLDTLFVLEVIQPTLQKESTYPRAITTSITLPSQLESIHDSIKYDKAGSILRMVEHILSTTSFKKAIQLYLLDGQNKHGGSVQPENLFEVLETQVKADSIAIPSQTSITKILKSWTENIGYPVVHVCRKSETKKFIFNQKPFTSKKSSTTSPDQEWIIPISCATKSSPKFDTTTPSVWVLDKSTVESSLTGDDQEWILCNLQQAGYYRVNYDERNWGLLIDQIKTNPESLPALSRASLIDDAFVLAESNSLSYNIPLRLVHAMEKDINVIPWIPAVSHLNKLSSKYADTPYITELEALIRDMSNNLRNNMGFDTKETDNSLTKTGRVALFSLLCRLKLLSCTQPALAEYNKNSVDISKVNPDMKEIVYCAALRHEENPQSVWNALWSLYDTTGISYDKQTIMAALACANEEPLIERTLARLNNRVRKQDRKYFIDALTYSSIAVTAALNFMKSKIITSDDLDEDTSASLKTIFASISPNIRTATHLKLVEDIDNHLKNRPELNFASFKNSISSTLQTAANRIQQNNKDAQELTTFIKSIINPPSNTQPDSIPKTTAAGITILPSCLYLVLSISIVLFVKYI